MTLVLDLPPELEARLAAAAADRTVSVETLVTHAIETFIQPSNPADVLKTRRDAVRAARGSMAHYPGSVDQFLADKRADVKRESAGRNVA